MAIISERLVIWKRRYRHKIVNTFSGNGLSFARGARPQPGQAQHKEHLCDTAIPVVAFIVFFITRRTIMAKGQQRKTKEAKKPKKQPAPTK